MDGAQPWDRLSLNRRDHDSAATSGAPKNRRATDVAEWLGANAQVGDLVLTACDDHISRLIRRGTSGAYSHVAVVTSTNTVTEAYDRAMTMSEDDEGVYEISFDLLARRGSLEGIGVLRPNQVDPGKLVALADRAKTHSPPFASLGAFLLAAIGSMDWAGEVADAHSVPLVNKVRQWAGDNLDFIGDGIARIHCAEFATRLYLGSGVPLRFDRPRLAYYMSRLKSSDERPWEDVAESSQLEAAAARSPWSDEATGSTVVALVKHTAGALQERRREDTPADWADFVMPSDFCRSPSFSPVGRLDLVEGQWRDFPKQI